MRCPIPRSAEVRSRFYADLGQFTTDSVPDSVPRLLALDTHERSERSNELNCGMRAHSQDSGGAWMNEQAIEDIVDVGEVDSESV